MRTNRKALLIVFFTVAGITAVKAGETAAEVSVEKNPVPIELSETSEWNYSFRPYLWTASLQGDVGAQGLTVPVDLAFDEIAKNLEFHLSNVSRNVTLLFR